MTSAIEKITLNAATFKGETVEPTLINFFYGNNGTGKSTIARTIGSGSGLSWREGKSSSNYNVLIYNLEFVEANFRGYSNLKGVFTVGEHNIQIQASIDERKQQKNELDKLIEERTAERSHKELAKGTLLETFQENCWNKTKEIREGFDATQGGYKRKAQFAERVMQITNPAQHDVDALKTLYETAFDPKAQVYREFQPLGSVTRLKGSRGNELLDKPITSSGDTPFAGFIKALHATDWIRQGHDHFAVTADGRCPYCQQELPDDFETQLSACFDAQYQEDIDALRQFQDDYASDMQGFIRLMKANLQQDMLPKLDLTEYKDKLAHLPYVSFPRDQPIGVGCFLYWQIKQRCCIYQILVLEMMHYPIYNRFLNSSTFTISPFLLSVWESCSGFFLQRGLALLLPFSIG